MTIDDIKDYISKTHAKRSAWARGVEEYALIILDGLNESDLSDKTERADIEKALLKGARDWEEYSYGGCALIYDGDIAKMLCTPSELKRTRNGERNLNGRETWLDVQARALRQAARLIKNSIRHILRSVQI